MSMPLQNKKSDSGLTGMILGIFLHINIIPHTTVLLYNCLAKTFLIRCPKKLSFYKQRQSRLQQRTSINIFSLFFREIRLDVSSESSARQGIHMKHQALFSSKDKSKKLKCRLLQFLFGALYARMCDFSTYRADKHDKIYNYRFSK